MVIALAAGSMLFMSKAFTAQMEKSSDIGESKKEIVTETAYEDDDDDFVYPDDVKNEVSDVKNEEGNVSVTSDENTVSEDVKVDL